MAKQLIGKAPLTLVRTVGGSLEYVYARKPVPVGADEADVKRLLDEGFLEVVGDVDEVPVEDPVPPELLGTVGQPGTRPAGADPGTQVGTGEPPAGPALGEPPARAAKKEAWVDFRVAQRGEEHREVLEGLTKDELQDDAAVDAALQPQD